MQVCVPDPCRVWGEDHVGDLHHAEHDGVPDDGDVRPARNRPDPDHQHVLRHGDGADHGCHRHRGDDTQDPPPGTSTLLHQIGTNPYFGLGWPSSFSLHALVWLKCGGPGEARDPRPALPPRHRPVAGRPLPPVLPARRQTAGEPQQRSVQVSGSPSAILILQLGLQPRSADRPVRVQHQGPAGQLQKEAPGRAAHSYQGTDRLFQGKVRQEVKELLRPPLPQTSLLSQI